MSDHRDSRLFPLPLVPFEEYMLVDDRPAHPATVFTRLRFRGRFDRAALEAALDITLTRHPLLTALVRPARRGRFQWIAAQPLQPTLHWQPQVRRGSPDPAETPDRRSPGPGRPFPAGCLNPTLHWQPNEGPPVVAAAPYIDLRREAGLRIFLQESGDQTQMLLQIHHACSDGLGHLCFLNDLLATYYETLSPSAAKTPRLLPLPELLPMRGCFGLTIAGWLARIPKDLLAALAAIEFFSHRPVPVAARSGNLAGDRPVFVERKLGQSPTCSLAGPQPVFPTFAAHTLSQSQTAQLLAAARQQGCSVNDLLLSALFLALDQWNLLHDPHRGRGVLRIMVPVNLRLAADARMPAANVVSMVYLDRRPHRFASPQALIKSVRREMAICKRWRLGLTLIHFIRLFRALPGGLARMLPEDRCLATTVLSNLGDLTDSLPLPENNPAATAGQVTLEEYDLLPPVRPWTSASFGAATYAGRLTVAVHCDRNRFRVEDAAALLTTFVGQITALVDGAD